MAYIHLRSDPQENQMIELKQKDDAVPLCPHSAEPLDELWFRELKSSLGAPWSKRPHWTKRTSTRLPTSCEPHVLRKLHRSDPRLPPKAAARYFSNLSMIVIACFALAAASCKGPRAGDPSEFGKFSVRVDVPAELSSYSGKAPVTFGVPFDEGKLKASDPMRLVNGLGADQGAQFSVTKKYAGTEDVKWLLVDAQVDISNGIPDELFLEYGYGADAAPISGGIEVLQSGGSLEVRTGSRVFPIDASLGDFVLEGVENGVMTPYSALGDSGKVTEIEVGGRIRTTIKMSGVYRSGSDSLGKYITRYRFYRDQSYVRIYHTMVWDRHGDVEIQSLKHHFPIPSNDLTLAINGNLEGHQGADAIQTAHNEVFHNIVRPNSTLDGFIQANDAEGEDIFLGLRWGWQQFPFAIYGTGQHFGLRLIGPKDNPMDLKPSSSAATQDLRDYVHPKKHWNIPKNRAPYHDMSPIGVGKTWELLVRFDPQGSISPLEKNKHLQHPIYAYADPIHATKANLPSRVSPKQPNENPVIETAMENVFDWMTLRDANDGDYGLWNYGDLQYNWNVVQQKFRRMDRYWMNHGNGWNVVPWMLYLRSGERKYLEEATAHSRHLMDVDTSHMDDEASERWVGGQSGYAPVHFGHHTYRAHFVNESEYLIYYYYLTGYERAKDVIDERILAILSTSDQELGTRDLLDEQAFLTSTYYWGGGKSAAPELMINRQHYGAFGEIALFYEFSERDDLKVWADFFLKRFTAGQASTGWMDGIKTPFWFSQSFDVAQWAMPHRQAEVRDVVNKWTDYKGMPSSPGTTGRVEGPYSLRNWVNLHEQTGDDKYLDAAIGAMRAQAMSVNTGPTHFRGYSQLTNRLAGSSLRDWMAVLDRAEAVGVDVQSKDYLPSAFFNSSLTTRHDVPDPWMGRHVALVQVNQQPTVTVSADYNGHNAGRYFEHKVRVYAPSGAMIHEEDLERHNFEGSYPPEFTNYMAGNHLTLTEAASFRKTFSVSFNPNEGAGAYAVEIYTRQVEVPLSIKSSTGKVVHYFPGYGLRAAHVPSRELYYDYKQILPSVSGDYSTMGGAFVMKPKSANEAVWLSYARVVYHVGYGLPTYLMPENSPLSLLHRLELGRLAILDSGNNVLCTNSIDSVNSSGHPEGGDCNYTVSSDDLIKVTTINVNFHRRMHIAGVLPYAASSEQEWFNPEDGPMPDMTFFLTPDL